MAQVEMTIDSVRRSLLHNEWIVILKDKKTERYLPIYIGIAQAHIMKRELINIGFPEQAYYDLHLEAIETMTGIDTRFSRLESVTINRFENNVYYAKLLVTYHGKSYEVDYPPAKAIALGVRARVPIFADETVLNEAGITVGA